MSGSALRIGAPVAPEVEKNALQRSAPGQQAGSDILPRTSLGLRRLPVGPAEAARRNKVLLFLVVETALALLGLWLIPHVLALFFLSAGSRALNRAIYLSNLPIPPGFACDVGPIRDPGALEALNATTKLLQNAVLFQPDDGQAHLQLARASCLLGQPEGAIQSYLAYTRLRPANPLGHLELGFAYHASGNISSAVREWNSIGVTAQDFFSSSYAALRKDQLDRIQRWNNIAGEITGIQPDTIIDVPGAQPLIFESFATGLRLNWRAYPKNAPGTFETENGILHLSYSNTPGKRAIFSFTTATLDIPIQEYHEILIRLRGSHLTQFTMELDVDGTRIRPANYLAVPEEWDVLTFPINGHILHEITLAIGENKASMVSEEHELSIDWLAIR